MNPIRKSTVAGATKEYVFNLDVAQFLVKNLSGGDIEVCLEKDGKDSWLIPDGGWQMIPGSDTRISRNSVWVKAQESSDRGVEVEAVKYRLLKRC